MVENTGGGYEFRIKSLERRVERIEDLEPAVVKSQVEDIKADISQLSDDFSYVRRILTGFLISFAFTGISIVVAIFVATGKG